MSSFIKWVGGKTQLLDNIIPIINSMEERYDEFVYVEPFVGGGAVLFNVLERCANLKYAIINDTNENLMKCYRAIADDADYICLKEALLNIQNDYNKCSDKRGFYEEARKIYNIGCKGGVLGNVDCASVFIFLNKTSFNGLYRENSKGMFNVPWNKKESITLFNEDDLDNIHILLKNKVIIMDGDFEQTKFAMEIARASHCGCVYYFDPPYRPLNGKPSFNGYGKCGFDDTDQERLKKYCDEIVKKGYGFVLSNSKSDDYFEKLYDGYRIENVLARRNVNSNGKGRGKVNELLIYSELNKEQETNEYNQYKKLNNNRLF